ncbi:hypothetical protein ALC57_06037 [Trachymyrmex cornetzi]|uniref:Uncharacterized protein n=1 Tax=Trachymyrmex cornetzi TaxID=471704 RepID=A0A151J921_9HYME|nr:hypothetical protein ALC57_06037 [Trachymyrmex cornetzi]
MEQYGSYNELYAREGVHHRTDGTRSRFVIVQRADKLAGVYLRLRKSFPNCTARHFTIRPWRLLNRTFRTVRNQVSSQQAQIFHQHRGYKNDGNLPGPLSMVRGLGGKSGETLKGFTGLRTLDSARIGSRSTGETKCTLKKEKEGKRERDVYTVNSPLSS